MFRRSRKQDPTDQAEASALCFVLLEKPRAVDAAALVDAWKSVWSDSPPPTNFTEKEGILAFDLGGFFGTVALMPAPVPADDLEGPAQTSWMWPDATEAVARSQAHFVVFAKGPAPQVDVHAALTRLVVSVLRASDGLGVYWGDAGHLVRADAFAGLAEVLGDDGLPLMLWLDLRAFSTDGRSTVFTVGMTAFGLMELEVPDSERPVGEVRELLTNIAAYLVRNGPVFNDGDTVGGTAEERISVRFAPSIVDRRGNVYRLDGA